MASYRTVTVDATVTENVFTATAEISPNVVTADAAVSTPIATSGFPDYEGSYEITPTQEIQTLDTENRALTASIIINPIPSNYGLITWDGAIMTVS